MSQLRLALTEVERRAVVRVASPLLFAGIGVGVVLPGWEAVHAVLPSQGGS